MPVDTQKCCKLHTKQKEQDGECCLLTTQQEEQENAQQQTYEYTPKISNER